VCGIAGIWTLGELNDIHRESFRKAVKCIDHRGPDSRGDKAYTNAMLGHSRLAIIDTSERANQPMVDTSGRYCLVFNGEIYNHAALGKDLIKTYGVTMRSSSDTEVLLYGLIHEGAHFLSKINGFFAFGFYDTLQKVLLCARDRYGIKPFYYSSAPDEVAFGSTLTAVMPFRQKIEIEPKSLFAYLQLSYIPDPLSMVKGIHKLAPGHLLKAGADGVAIQPWYHIDENAAPSEGNPVSTFKELLQNAVRRRLLADVPVGTFLSGGLDSSVITLLASRERADIPAFSIGFPKQAFFDESAAARAMAKHLKVKHHVFDVYAKDLEEELSNILNAMDEPFADSSAVLVSILSKRTRQEVKVALSGDGADELLGGYNKHRALLRSLDIGFVNNTLRGSAGFLNLLPASRNHPLSNKLRKVKRYSRGLKLDFAERYLEWASFTPGKEVTQLLQPSMNVHGMAPEVLEKLRQLDPRDFNSVLRTDMGLVLAGDMLHKVDSMSMHRSLEVRVPFLDHEVVSHVFGLPAGQKIDKDSGKKLLRKAYGPEFPAGFFDKGKRGFEAPLRHWLNTVLSPELDRLTGIHFIESQGIFNFREVQKLRRRVRSLNSGDAPHTLWAILVFQHWWERHLSHVIQPK
jgi:asparagine synthase (glutamine-hydrolysing)